MTAKSVYFHAVRYAKSRPIGAAWRRIGVIAVVGVVCGRCPPSGEVCGRFKSAFARFRHAAPRNQHPRSRVSSRRLREIDPRLGGSSAAAPDEYGWPVQ